MKDGRSISLQDLSALDEGKEFSQVYSEEEKKEEENEDAELSHIREFGELKQKM